MPSASRLIFQRSVISLFVLLSFVPGSNADVSLGDIEAALEVEFDESLRDEFGPMLKTYNSDRGNKAISFAITDTGGVTAGMGYKAQSELAASQIAIQQCRNWLREHEQTGECEILLLGEQIIRPGAILRAQVTEDTPAMAWKIKGPNADLYLLGTLHVLKTSLLPMPHVFDQFFAAADIVAFETNPHLSSDPARQAELANLFLATAKEQKKLYSRGDRKVLKKYAKSQSFDVNSFYSVKPVLNALQITQLKISAIGYSMETGVEMHYARQASQLGKPIRELETPAEALDALVSLSPELQVEMLTGTIADLDQAALGIETIVSGWLTGDAEGVYAQTVEDMVSEPELIAVAAGMLDDRNLRWMDKIDQLLESDKSSVVMVGSAHIGGEQGLLSLLRNRGYEPVQYSWDGQPLGANEPMLENVAKLGSD